MPLPTIHPPNPILLHPEPLSPASFAPFGTVITTPLPSHLTKYPSFAIPPPLHPTHQPQSIPANQSTALKTSPISPLTNNYDSQSTTPANGLMSIFSSFPRRNTYYTTTTDTNTPSLRLRLGILERHPYTTQTFCPFNYSQPDEGSAAAETYMLIIVAPTTDDPTSTPPNPPDLSAIRAFVAPLTRPAVPVMAVTYAPGTWHAPMIVLGARRVDFVVTQFANGVAGDDVQEVEVGDGPDGAVLGGEERERRRKGGEGNVEVDVGFVEDGFEWEDLEAKWTTDEAVRRTVGSSRRAKL